jgi:hypothetical protein
MEVSGQRHAPAALPLGNNGGTHCLEGWVGPRAGLNRWGEQKVFWPPGLEPRDRPVRSESLSRRHFFFIDLMDTTYTYTQQDRPTSG